MTRPWKGSVMQARKVLCPYLMRSGAVAEPETSGMLSRSDACATAIEGVEVTSPMMATTPSSTIL